MIKEKEEAERIYNDHYVSIFEYGLEFLYQSEELSEEIVISLLANKAALIQVKDKYYALREQLFNLRSCGMIQSDRVYLSRLEELIQREAKVKQEIEKL